jgi:MFS family permease
VVAAMIMGSSVAGIDSTVVAVALPAIGRNLHVGFQALQWTVTSYTLTLASLILLAGSLSDRWGRRRVFLAGLGWFTVASVLCAAAPGIGWLIAARAVQGIGGALMTPASLAIIEAAFRPGDRTRAIGIWAGFSGVSAATAPFLGGWLLEAGTWRAIFLINVPVAAVAAWVTRRHVPESRDTSASGSVASLGRALIIDSSCAGVRSGRSGTSCRARSNRRAKLFLIGPHKVPTAERSSLSDSPTRALMPGYSVAHRSYSSSQWLSARHMSVAASARRADASSSSTRSCKIAANRCSRVGKRR